jgi:hypothetical protein
MLVISVPFLFGIVSSAVILFVSDARFLSEARTSLLFPILTLIGLGRLFSLEVALMDTVRPK